MNFKKILFFSLLLFPLAIFSYQVMGSRWGSPIGPINPNFAIYQATYGYDNSFKDNLGSNYNSIVEQSVAAWNGKSNFVYVTPASLDPFGGAGGPPNVPLRFDTTLNILRFLTPNTIGVTLPQTSGWLLTSAPIFIFGLYQNGSVNYSMYNDQNYFKATVTHELGHATGLNHSADSSAIMYPTVNVFVNKPATDDINGIRSIYGYRPPPPSPEEAVDQFCSIFGLEGNDVVCLFIICYLAGICK
ncbi:matrixin family metalloprotease [Leptospira neocaledonica]|uniref:Peptidase metallopeptidase domain-containing protein n=1 Tax=Leptospira neocaledonica TaxID=2023192 RepID=A0A2M9ZZK3_9LEPT|nr:matrixin family metalloprotease [Leptospira neocaledonica]PJZ77492.1 hypothetical protein CH365_07890 [Leptospira neocaledonica]